MSNDVLTEVRRTFNEFFGVDPDSVSLQTVAYDVPGWDSVGHLSVCGALAETFEVEFDTNELAEMNSVRAIVSIIKAKKGILANGVSGV